MDGVAGEVVWQRFAVATRCSKVESGEGVGSRRSPVQRDVGEKVNGQCLPEMWGSVVLLESAQVVERGWMTQQRALRWHTAPCFC